MIVRLPGPTDGLSIGLLGGSFNPAHTGHLHVAETAMRRLGLDWVWWIVAKGNPLKQDHGSFTDRLASVETLLIRQPRMRATGIEVALGVTYTIDLLDWLKTRCPGTRFVWLMGGDNLASFNKWKSWHQIAQALPIAIVSRQQTGRRTLVSGTAFARRFRSSRLASEAAGKLPFLEGPSWVYLPAPLNPLSSTRIRNGTDHLDA